MNMPHLTPFEVAKRLENNKEGSFIEKGWKFTLEGCQMSPPESWAPVAILEDDELGDAWYSACDIDEQPTEKTEWIK